MPLVHYKMHETVLDDCVCVEAVMYHSTAMRGSPTPPLTSDGIPYNPLGIDMANSSYRTYVPPPNIIERLRGVTYDAKLENARKRIVARALKAVTKGTLMYRRFTDAA